MKDETLIKIAEIVSTESKCNRAKVGAVIVKNKRIIATGYNGTPSGTCNDCEENNTTKPSVIHAEINAILNATTEDLTNSTLYITMSPCETCAAFIKQKGISRVVYSIDYRDTKGIDYLRKEGVFVDRYKTNNHIQ